MANYGGTPDDDVILGGDDDDILRGGAGNDTLRGGPGNDVLEGGAGADEVDGGEDDGLSPFVSSYRDLIWGDTATYLDSDAGVTIDLATGTAQGGHAEGDTLTEIESIRGSGHADVLVARNEGSTLWGQRGDDLLSGGTGTDYLWGDQGDDTLMGGAGFDYLEGGAGADVLDGGAFFDYAGYSLSDAGVTVNLATGEAEGGHAEGDTLIEIELVWGSSHADRITGNAELNYFIGGAGADTLDGGAGLDTAFYVDSDAGVTVNLATGAAEGGHAEGDTLAGIEGVFGSRHDDHFIGGDDNAQLGGWFGNDTLEGGAGNDRLEGGAGADVIDGGGGDWNFAAYWNSDAGVTVNLATGTGQGGHAEGDTLTNILGVVGSNQADHLIGHDEHNNLQGRDGDDTLEGGAGNDTLEGGLGADMLDGDGGNLDSAAYWSSEAGVTVNLAAGTGQGGEAEGDTLTGIRRIFGSRHADTLTALDDDPATEEAEGSIIHAGDGDDTLQGGTGTDHLDGGAGADVLDGGEGLDYAAYWGSDAGVTINLATGTAQGGHAEGDALMGIERVHGSDHADHLTGDSGDNALHGEAGNDTLEGGAGDDWLRGNAGEDLLTGGEDADTFVFGDGDTVADFQDGSDRIEISDFGHINADNFEANVTIRQSGSNEDTPDPFDFGRGDPFDFGRGDPFDFGRDDPFDFGRDDPFDFGRDDPFDFGRDDPFDFGRGDPVADVEVQIGDAVLTLTGVSAADITVDDFILA